MIAKNLKVLRRSKGWTQKRTAYNLEMQRTTYQAYEDGRAEPCNRTLIKISELYSVTIDKLLKEEIKLEVANG
jgi:transcriptional regulator with XRE-family HTH domain